MADDERRAEIEAMRRAYAEWQDGKTDKPFEHMLAAVDRVRDARGDDEQRQRQRFWCPDCGASEIHHDWCYAFPGEPVVHGNRQPPPRQDEGHEADDLSAEDRIEMLIRERDHAWSIVESFQRSSPSRDGTVAVEAHDAYVEPLDGGHRGYQARCWTCDWTGPEHLRGMETLGSEESRAHKRAAREDAAAHRAEFSRPEQPEPDALGGLPPSQPKEDQR